MSPPGYQILTHGQRGWFPSVPPMYRGLARRVQENLRKWFILIVLPSQCVWAEAGHGDAGVHISWDCQGNAGDRQHGHDLGYEHLGLSQETDRRTNQRYIQSQTQIHSQIPSRQLDLKSLE